MTFSIPQRARLALCGRSGSGKSSLLTAILRGLDESVREDDLVKGELRLLGTSFRDAGREEWRRCFSYVAQEPLVWSDTIRNLLTVGLPESSRDASLGSDAELWQALEAVGLKDRVVRAFNGLDSVLNGEASASDQLEKGEEAESEAQDMTTQRSSGSLRFSEGEVQLLTFARALVERDRPIIVLDEVTSRLDAQKSSLVKEVIRSSPLLHARTVIAVSHSIGESRSSSGSPS